MSNVKQTWARRQARLIMSHKLKSTLFATLGLSLLIGSAPAWALGPISPLGLPTEAQVPRVNVSFWAKPFPFGYTGWGHCIRYERIDTEWGPRFRRISLCGGIYYSRHRVLRVRG